MSLTSLAAFVLLALSVAMAWQRGWIRPHPVLALLAAWTPALLFSLVPVEFVDPAYAVLNAGVSPSTYFLLALGLLAFALGALTASDLLRTQIVRLPKTSATAAFDSARLVLPFAFGLTVYGYAFWHSGLAPLLLRGGTPEDIFAGRLAFHVGFINHFVLLLDVCAVLFFAKFIVTRRWRHALPVLVSLAAYVATLQKSRVLFITFSAVFLMLLHWRETRRMFFSSARRAALTLGAVAALVLLLLATNRMRGIGEYRYTNFASPLVEQVYIYCGAPALLNLSGTIDGRISTDAPTHGRIFLRTWLWPFVDRDTLNPTRHLEGINNGTAALYFWHDFGLAGVIGGAFASGLLVTLSFFAARSGSPFGLVAGAIGFNAVMMSVFTEVLFEPTTMVVLVLGAGLSFLCAEVPPAFSRAGASPAPAAALS